VDTKAIHAKLDELIHGVPDADDGLAGIERDT
jgi:low affinity Fe/Cu permease